jgi:hypothetical protein
MDPVRDLKVDAEILHRRIASGSADAVARLRAMPELRESDDATLTALAPAVRRKHCLAVVAREAGFSSWNHARRAIDGDPREADFGTLLYSGDGTRGFLHPWFAAYGEAAAFVDQALSRGKRAYLLPFRRHFFAAEGDFVRALGLDADDADWVAIGWDWARPKDPTARRRLYAKRIAAVTAARRAR